MSDSITRLAELLKNEREKLGKSLDEIAKHTKIKKKYLEAIEKGDLDSFPASIYLKGYVKAYAKYLGLNHEPFIELIDEYYIYEKKKSGEIADHEINKEITQKVSQTNHTLPISPISIILFAAFIVIVVTLLLLLGRNKSTQTYTESEYDFLVDTSTVSGLDMTKAGENVSQSILVEFGRINPVWAIARVDSLTMDLEVEQDMGLLVETDYRRAYKGWVKTGEKFTWRAKNAFFFTADRPEALDITINGFQLKRFPPSAGPRDIYIERDKLLSLLEGVNPENENLTPKDTIQEILP